MIYSGPRISDPVFKEKRKIHLRNMHFHLLLTKIFIAFTFIEREFFTVYN